MPDPRGFITIQREPPRKRKVQERIRDWHEIYTSTPVRDIQNQAARCMDCGIPFCHSGCPLGNLIPEWNELVYRGEWRAAYDRLQATNNFPEFTGKLCPAPCEPACVLDLWNEPVTIKQIEMSIIDRAFQSGWITPQPPAVRTGKRVAVIGSGPAGLAAAQQLNRAGHTVNVFERDDRPGGLIRYGIPDFKMEKRLLDRRLQLMKQEGITFHVNAAVGQSVPTDQVVEQHDAVVLTMGATKPRDLPIPGRDLEGVHFAMDYLTVQNRLLAGDTVPSSEHITAAGKRVAIIGGGDTGADCLGTAVRQGASSITQIQRWPQPPDMRSSSDPWPQWPEIFRMSPAHEEAGAPEFAISTQRFLGIDGRVIGLEASRVDAHVDDSGRARLVSIPGSTFTMDVDLVLLAIGYNGPEPSGLVTDLGLTLTPHGTIETDSDWMTGHNGVFAAGDATRGQSLIVWAIADGRKVARNVDRHLMGSTLLP